MRPASRASRPRARPIAPRPSPTSTPSRSPGTAARLHTGTRRGEGATWDGRMWREGCQRQAGARRAEVPAPAWLGSSGPCPTTHRRPPHLRSQCPAGPGRGSGSPIVSLASGPHLPVSKPPIPGPGVPAPAPRVMLREGGGCGSPEGVRGGGLCRQRGVQGGGLGVRGWRGCGAGPPGRQCQLTHLQPGLSSGGNSGGGGGGGGGSGIGSAAPGAPGWEMVASAAVSRPIPRSGGGCSGLQASRASRPRARPLSPPHAPPPPLPAVQARPPGCTLGCGAGKGPLGRRAWGEKGAKARPERGEQRCWLPLVSAALDPAPPPTGAPSSLFAAPRWAWGGGVGGVGALVTVDS